MPRRSSGRRIWTAADDLAAAYKQLLQVERGWRDMKGALGLRPVFHYREDRIQAHVQLCWLALLLLRVVENATDDTWRNVRHGPDRMHLVTLSTPDGQIAQRSALTAGQRSILTALKLPEPPRACHPERLTGHFAATLAVVTRRGSALTAFSQVKGLSGLSCAHDLRKYGRRASSRARVLFPRYARRLGSQLTPHLDPSSAVDGHMSQLVAAKALVSGL